jgi:hypothetical protein
MRVETYVHRKQSFIRKDWVFPLFYKAIIQKNTFQLIVINY